MLYIALVDRRQHSFCEDPKFGWDTGGTRKQEEEYGRKVVQFV